MQKKQLLIMIARRQSKRRTFWQVMSLQDQNAALAEMMLRWKAHLAKSHEMFENPHLSHRSSWGNLQSSPQLR